MILIGTGSEVALCVDAHEELAREGIAARVVSMPSWELFEQQDQAYRDKLLPPEVTARVSVEQASVIGWDRCRDERDRHAHLWLISSAQELAYKVRIHTGQRGCGGQRSDREIAKAEFMNSLSGQGPWTVEATIEEAVAADVITAALFTRFRLATGSHLREKSCQPYASASAVNLKGKNPSTPSRNLRMRHAVRQRKRQRAPLDDVAMLDKGPIRTPPAAQLIACPPKQQARLADPCALVIFGATGDLTKRLVVPALYNLSRSKVLPEQFALIGVARTEATAGSWRERLHDMLKSFVGHAGAEFNTDHIDEDAWARLADKMTYISGDLTKPDLYEQVRAALDKAEKAHSIRGNAIFYLAIADRLFGTVVEQLGKAKLTDQGEDQNGGRRFWRRVVIEKPFGHSLDSARALNSQILRTLHEDQIFRIDHFLGKDTVQNIMAFRFANGIFEPIWNRDRIDHVQITAAETVGVEGRGSFYETTGALRDMVPNHLFTLLSMVTMEPPVGFDAAAIRSKKAELLAAIPEVKPSEAVRGQYGAGTVLGKRTNAYRQEPNVAPNSNVETYVALRLEIDNWRWAGVPFYLRTGKYLPQRNTEIAICFKQAPYAAFQDTPVDTLRPNWLVLRIAPDEGISLQFEVKRRGPVMDLAAVKMDFHYDDWFTKEPNVGYETLLYDVMIGDPTLFMRADMVEQTWRIVQPVLDTWAKISAADLTIYPAGSAGPSDADALLAEDGRSWRGIVGDHDGQSS